MADNYLERKYRDYEVKKKEWLRKQKRYSFFSVNINRPENENS